MKETVLYEKSNRAKGEYPYIGFNTDMFNFIDHFHEEIELIYMVEGKTLISSDDGFCEISTGEICIIMPGEIHGFISSNQNKIIIVKAALAAEEEKINFALLRLKSRKIGIGHPLHSEAEALILDMYAEDGKREFGYEFAIKHSLNRFYMLMLRGIEHEFIDIAEKERIQSGLTLLKNVNEYLEVHYRHEIRLSDIASHCKYSVYYFAHFFKDVTGISFGDYLAIFRLKKSSALMSASDAKLTEISAACGFNNIRSFNRMFKKHFGSTPREYRSRLGG